MTKTDLMLVFGTGSAIAQLFKPYNGGKPISKAAISEWGKMERIPELREFQLRKLFPDIDERIAKAKRKNGRAVKRLDSRAPA